MNYVHSPVLLEEIIKNLVGEQDNLFLDCTVGEGGHSEAVLTRFPQIKVVGLDRDKEILQLAKERLSVFGERFNGVNLNFRDASKLNEIIDVGLFDCALVDLGVSVYHYKKSGRGFSFLEEEKLDMRLDSSGTSVSEIINNYSFEELRDIFFKCGEEKFSREIARKIVFLREKKLIESTKDLEEVVVSAIPPKFRNTKINPATKIFQALRIVANNEFENIEIGIPQILSLLKVGGKLGVITFHSLEDRIVKHLFNFMEKECICPPKIPKCVCGKKKLVKVIGKSITPTDEEIQKNPPSRSARLRIVEKVL
ncbi:MAG: 16S rRNA (cytosine(1402)-N(4))-methyltransferase [Spirochaetes bacterium GWD1_27_9]|nr:MAG: 16S rRNA (cytosine(1402)-N(4))-methyltransferase [Spirochaetes bacterium GWB1_27_13]OHD42026.1 MAG: 16S rRNA (cytosine(1402)-N(4))-methyltransferase [Spirochaetes bacterium GWD1_27_9]